LKKNPDLNIRNAEEETAGLLAFRFVPVMYK
jgi:hypothetical protein